MAEDNNQVITKKVSPYPFPIQITLGEGGVQQKGSVVKLTQVGYLCEFVDFLPTVGTEYMAEFKLPTFPDQFLIKVKVIKTYDRYTGGAKVMSAPGSAVPTEEEKKSPDVAPPGASSKSIHLAEMHFVKHSLLQKQSILRWLMKIKQVK